VELAGRAGPKERRQLAVLGGLPQITIQDAYPLPRIDESLDALAGSKYFSALDLLSSYWQVPLSPDAQEKAAFITRDGLWKWKVLPFGLTSAPATFQRLMKQVFSGLHWKTLLVYLDDVIVISQTFRPMLIFCGRYSNDSEVPV